MQTVFNQSIWGDEGFSAILSMKSVPEILEIIARDTSPPLWNIFEHYAFQFFGTGEVVIRSLSATFFLLTILFTYKIGALLFSKKTGLIAALLTFLNPFFFTYAFEGRMYSIMALGVAASMYFYLRFFLEEEVSLTTKLGYVFFSLWALYSHHFSFFAFAIQGVWFLYELAFGRRKRAKKIFKLFLLVGVGYIPWLIPLYNQTKMVGGGFWLGTPTPTDLRKLIYDYLAEGIKQLNFILPIINLKIYELALYAVLTTLILRNWFKNFKRSLFLVLWFLGPIVLTWLVSQKFQSIFFNRYILYTIPAAMLIVASGRRKLSIIFITIIILIFSYIDYYYFVHPTKLPFRQMSEFVKNETQEGDYLINWYSNGTHHIWETKYYGIPAPIYDPGEGELPFFVGTALMEEGDIIREIPKGVERVGVVTSGTVEEVNIPGYTESEVKSFNSLKFIWYSKSSPDEP